MTRWRDCLAPIIGRILVGGYFLWSGIFNALNFDSVLLSLQSLPYLHVLMPLVIAIGAILIEVAGGIMLILGWHTRIAAAALAFYIIAASLALHTEAFNGATSSLELLKNFAIAGGLLYMTAYGSGEWSKLLKMR